MAKSCKGGSKGRKAVSFRSHGKLIKFKAKSCQTPSRLKKYAAAAKICAGEGKRVGTKSMGACIVKKAR